MREGDYSNDLLAIEIGTADVVQGDRTVAHLGPGDIVGEAGVLSEGACATRRWCATSPMRLFRLTTWEVKRLPTETRERLADLVRSRQWPRRTAGAAVERAARTPVPPSW